MPKSRWTNAAQQRQFQERKKQAPLGLLDALENQRIFGGGGTRLYTAKIIECFDD